MFTLPGVVLGPALCYYSRWRYGPEQGRMPVYYLGGPQEATPKTQQPEVLPSSNLKMHTLSLWLLLDTAGLQTFPPQFWASCGPRLAPSKEEAVM